MDWTRGVLGKPGQCWDSGGVQRGSKGEDRKVRTEGTDQRVRSAASVSVFVFEFSLVCFGWLSLDSRAGLGLFHYDF